MTDFQEIVVLMRAFTFDSDESNIRNNDEMLAVYITSVLNTVSVSIGFDRETLEFSKALSDSQRVEIAGEASVQILCGMPEYFSYKTPVMSGSRKYNVARIVGRIKQVIEDARHGRTDKWASGSTEIDLLVNDTTLYTEQLAEASS